MSKIIRGDGFTRTEKHLKYLCERSFLSLWSYPNLFRDQGKRPGSAGDGKEICDLLVVFGNEILIFADRFCEFPDRGNIIIEWKRWYKKAIEDQIKTIFGAAAWIKEHPDRIYIDKHCTQKLPFHLGPQDRIRFHYIIVASGAGERCRKELGGSGSLMLVPGMDSPLSAADKDVKPFCIGALVRDNNIVHVFDDVTLDIVMGELDTIVDFVRYLREKERFIGSGNLIVSCGEEELLSLYMMSKLSERVPFRYVGSQPHLARPPEYTGAHKLLQVSSDLVNGGDFQFPDTSERAKIYLDEGHWLELLNSPEYKDYKNANKLSYKWDAFIERIGKFALDDQLTDPRSEVVDRSIGRHEKNIRLWASTSRAQRASLCAIIEDLYRSSKDNEFRFQAIRLLEQPDVAYLFLLVPYADAASYEHYREIRQSLLTAYCMIFKWKQPGLKHVLGIATEARGMRGASEEFMRIDAEEWNPENDRIAAELQEKLEILKEFDWKKFMNIP